MAAGDKTLCMPELLQAIFLQLPKREILATASRVSRFWKAAIEESPTIQQHLFFKSKTSIVVEPYNLTDNASSVYIYESLLQPNDVIESSETRRTASNKLWCISKDDDGYVPLVWLDYMTLREGPLEHRQPWLSPKASWRRMLLTDPPCSVVCVNIDRLEVRLSSLADELFAGNRVSFCIRDRSGIRLGLVEDLVQQAMDNQMSALRQDLVQQAMDDQMSTLSQASDATADDVVRWNVVVSLVTTESLSEMLKKLSGADGFKALK